METINRARRLNRGFEVDLDDMDYSDLEDIPTVTFDGNVLADPAYDALRAGGY
jgi:hypothetical protein